MFLGTPDIGIDFGTANTRIYVRGRGIVINEPSVLVVDANDRLRKKIPAAGDDAVYLLGRTTASLIGIAPIKYGAIDDFDMAVLLLRHFIRKAIGVSHITKPKVLVAIPSSLTSVQRKAVQQAAQAASGSKHIYLIEKSFASAIGTGLPVYEATGTLVMDIGSGTTDVALVSLGGIVVAQSIPVGGAKMDEAIASYIRSNFHMMISRRTAEDVKLDLGSAVRIGEDRKVRIRGRDTIFSSATDIEFTSAQCREALEEPVKAIIAALKWVLERTPPELASDVMRSGIHLTGGASLLYGLDQAIAQKMKIPVLVAKDPMDCAILGLGFLAENTHLITSMSRQVTNTLNTVEQQ